MSLIQFILLVAGLILSLIWLLRSRAPQNVAIRVRDVASDLERMLRDRRGVYKREQQTKALEERSGPMRRPALSL